MNQLKISADQLWELNDSIAEKIKESSSDMSFYRCIDSEYDIKYNSVLNTILSLGNKIWSIIDNISKSSIQLDRHPTGHFDSLEDILTDYDKVVDSSDHVFEHIDTSLDSLSGKIPSISSNIISSISLNGASQILSTKPMIAEVHHIVDSKNIDIRFIHARNIARPQMEFKDKIDNSSAPFVHKLLNKPNSMIPLDDIDQMEHPYSYELDHFNVDPIHCDISISNSYQPFITDDYLWIDQEHDLISLSKLLNQEKEYAIDLEHHSYRSYQGFTCLIQISTRSKDYLIDALILRHCLQCLNSSMTNPHIVKVLHGSEQDIQWLQRDFGLYLVNVFDTFIASKILNFPSNSLAFLLEHYVQLSVDKKYQLADWRIRPLPSEMIKYAREDTHYLLYIYDRIKNDLNQKDLIERVFKQGVILCSRPYEKQLYDPESSWKTTFYKHAKPFHKSQLNVFKALHIWRDHIAREEDESVRFVLPNHMLFQIAERMPKSQDILSCCQPVPPLVRQHATDLSILIEKAKHIQNDPLISAQVKDENEKIVSLPIPISRIPSIEVIDSQDKATSSILFQCLSKIKPTNDNQLADNLLSKLPFIGQVKSIQSDITETREQEKIETKNEEALPEEKPPIILKNEKRKYKEECDIPSPIDYSSIQLPSIAPVGRFDPLKEIGNSKGRFSRSRKMFKSSSFKNG